MTSKILNYTSSIVADKNDPSQFSYILVENYGNLSEGTVNLILEDVSSRYAWVYAQSRIHVLPVRIINIETITRMHSVEEYDSQDYWVENSRVDL